MLQNVTEEIDTKWTELIYNSQSINKQILFSKALSRTRQGYVLYISSQEVKELPESFIEASVHSRQYLKLLTFLYVNSLESLVEKLSTLPDWQNIPATIILDGIGDFCIVNHLQTVAGLVALLIDAANCCSAVLKIKCCLIISMNSESNDHDGRKVIEEVFLNVYK